MPRSRPEQARAPRQGEGERQAASIPETVEPSQRQRLLSAVAQAVERDGYGATSVAKIIAAAGVSRATFYESFADKDDCLLASYEALAQRLSERVLSAAQAAERATAPHASLSSLLEMLESEPNAGWGMLFAPLGGGPEIRAFGRRITNNASQLLAGWLLGAPANTPRTHVPALALLGGVRQVIARRLRRVEYDILPALREDLLAWGASYTHPNREADQLAIVECRWPTGPPARPARSKASAASPRGSKEAAAQRLPRGRNKQPDSVVARQIRERIIGATAQITMSKGYTEMTVADIVACAGIGRDVFYVHFRDKQDAFLAAQQHNLHDHLSTCSAAFFAGSSWPERIWSGLSSALEIIASDPALAHLWLVESFAAGPLAVQHTEEMMSISTLYLQEGYHYRPEAASLPLLCSEAIVGAIYEIVYHEVDEDRSDRLAELLPILAYIAIAPFTGVAQAQELIDGYMKAEE